MYILDAHVLIIAWQRARGLGESLQASKVSEIRVNELLGLLNRVRTMSGSSLVVTIGLERRWYSPRQC